MVTRESDSSASRRSDRKEGRRRPLTAKGQQQETAVAERQKLHPFDGPEDIALGERCITGTVPMFGAGYNNYYQIVQHPNYVAINMEMRHDTRMIPTGNRPHAAATVHQWLRDPAGGWAGSRPGV